MGYFVKLIKNVCCLALTVGNTVCLLYYKWWSLLVERQTNFPLCVFLVKTTLKTVKSVFFCCFSVKFSENDVRYWTLWTLTTTKQCFNSSVTKYCIYKVAHQKTRPVFFRFVLGLEAFPAPQSHSSRPSRFSFIFPQLWCTLTTFWTATTLSGDH